VTAAVEVASVTVNLVQAGENFATGNDLGGVLGVAGAIGGALQDIGAAEPVSSVAGVTGSGIAQFGQALSEYTAVASGIDGVVNGAESGNILTALTGALGAFGGAAGLAGDTTAQQFAALGAGLASTVQNGENGDVLAALDSFVQAANSYQKLGGISGITQDIDALWGSFLKSMSDTPLHSLATSSGSSPSIKLDFVSPASASAQGAPGYTEITENLPDGTQKVVGICLLDMTDPNNVSIYDGVEADVNNGQFSGQYIVLGHGNPDFLSNVSGAPLGLQNEVDYSAESVANTLLTTPSLGYTPGQSVQIVGCDTASAADNLAFQYGNNNFENFPTTLSTSLGGASVTGANGTLYINSLGAYFLNTSPNYSLTVIANDTTAGQFAPDNTLINNAQWLTFGTPGAGNGVAPWVQVMDNFLSAHPNYFQSTQMNEVTIP